MGRAPSLLCTEGGGESFVFFLRAANTREELVLRSWCIHLEPERGCHHPSWMTTDRPHGSNGIDVRISFLESYKKDKKEFLGMIECGRKGWWM